MNLLSLYRLCTFIVVFGLGIGVIALSVQTVYSNTFARVDANRHFDVLYADIAIGAGISTAVGILVKLLRDCCHRPLPIVFELIWSSIMPAVWIATAVITLVQNGKNFADSVCNDPNSTVNDVCKDSYPMALLSAAVAALYMLYALLLGFIGCVAAKRGKAIWMCPVAPGSTRMAATQDVEWKAGGEPVA
ncbi:hypothetical protein OH77DRAFT_526165 [Trametes cingulata]|nr:hypothetical protein OH77DRAFT_526165 [Trametes cingulata]